jgi:hypothetical protein
MRVIRYFRSQRVGDAPQCITNDQHGLAQRYLLPDGLLVYVSLPVVACTDSDETANTDQKATQCEPSIAEQQQYGAVAGTQ